MQLVIIKKFPEVVAFNSYITKRFFLDHNPPGKKDFAALREELILQLAGNWRAKKGKPGRKRQSQAFRLENVSEHLPMKMLAVTTIMYTWQVCMEKRHCYTLSHPNTPKNQVPYKMTKLLSMIIVIIVKFICASPREKNCFKALHTQVDYWKD